MSHLPGDHPEGKSCSVVLCRAETAPSQQICLDTIIVVPATVVVCVHVYSSPCHSCPAEVLLSDVTTVSTSCHRCGTRLPKPIIPFLECHTPSWHLARTKISTAAFASKLYRCSSSANCRGGGYAAPSVAHQDSSSLGGITAEAFGLDRATVLVTHLVKGQVACFSGSNLVRHEVPLAEKSRPGCIRLRVRTIKREFSVDSMRFVPRSVT
jgi:hypothetical protein